MHLPAIGRTAAASAIGRRQTPQHEWIVRRRERRGAISLPGAPDAQPAVQNARGILPLLFAAACTRYSSTHSPQP
eukprot:gene13587-biopygen14104